MTDPIEELREVLATLPAPGPLLAPYLKKVRTCAYAIADRDVDELKAAGVSEDEIFEATVAVAVDEGLRRLDASCAVLG